MHHRETRNVNTVILLNFSEKMYSFYFIVFYNFLKRFVFRSGRRGSPAQETPPPGAASHGRLRRKPAAQTQDLRVQDQGKPLKAQLVHL